MVDTITAQRLALVKYLFGVAVEQSKQPDPMSSISVMTLHDTAEWMLALSVEAKGIPDKAKGRTDFLEYWPLLKDRDIDLGVHLTAMSRLNDVRKVLKHRGLFPSKLHIETHVENTRRFLADCARAVFGVEIATLSLIDFIPSDEVKNELLSARAAADGGDLREGLRGAAMAMALLLGELGLYRPSRMTPHLWSSRGISLSREKEVIDNKARDQVNSLWQDVKSLDKQLLILRLGADFSGYRRFRSLTPSLDKLMNGTWLATWGNQKEPTRDDFDFCLDFVTELGIKHREELAEQASADGDDGSPSE